MRKKTSIQQGTEHERNQVPEQATNQAKAAAPKKVRSLWEDLLHLLLKILIILTLFAFAFTALFGLTRYNNLSMDPFVREGDIVIYYRLDKHYIASDLVAVRYQDEVHILRVVAVAGDTVDIKEDGLYINGYRQQEPDPAQITLPYVDQVDFPLTLRNGEVFLLGDNRSVAIDSRVFGAVQTTNTLGKGIMLFRRRNF
jgi:signal peptidase I